MRSILKTALVATLATASAAQAQTVMTALALSGATTCPEVVFISDIGKEGLFAPTAGKSTDANNGTTLPCGTKLFKRIYDGGTVNAKWFGLVEGNGPDNSKAVQNAINSLRDGQELLIPEGSYTFRQSIHLPANRAVRLTARGTLSFNGFDGIIVEGESGHTLDLSKIVGTPWEQYPSYDSYVGSAITLLNAKHVTLKVRWIEGFRNGIKLTGQGHDGSQYNKIDFTVLIHNDVGVLLTTESDGQLNWVNENTFTGGRISGRTGLSAVPGSSQIDSFNGNKFYNIGFEDVTNGVDVDKFASNIFIAPRLERVTNGFKFGPSSQDNTIVASFVYEPSFVSQGAAGNGGTRTLLLGRLLIPSPDSMISGVVSIADDHGRFLGLIRDPSGTVKSKTTAIVLPLAPLTKVSP